MRERTIRIIFLALLLGGNAFAHSGKPKFHVIIDTDGAIDDMRAISMFLSGNDGIQISTGATIGQGLIFISDTISQIPAATFKFNNQKVEIALKPEIALQMRDEIANGVKNFGLLSEQYWLYIEKLAIGYWANFDRHEIFLIRNL